MLVTIGVQAWQGLGTWVDHMVVAVVVGTVGVNLLNAGIVLYGGQQVALRTGHLQPASVVVDNVVAVGTAELDAQVDAFPGEGVAEAPCELGFGVTDDGLVVVGDIAVAVEVGKAVVTEPYATLADGLVALQVKGHHLHVAVGILIIEVGRLVEHADDLIAPELADGVSHLRPGDVGVVGAYLQ